MQIKSTIYNMSLSGDEFPSDEIFGWRRNVSVDVIINTLAPVVDLQAIWDLPVDGGGAWCSWQPSSAADETPKAGAGMVDLEGKAVSTWWNFRLVDPRNLLNEVLVGYSLIMIRFVTQADKHSDKIEWDC